VNVFNVFVKTYLPHLSFTQLTAAAAAAVLIPCVISCPRLVYHGQLASTYEGRVPPFSDVDHSCTVTRVPLGVCALVTPWNHPLLIAVKKVSVALATGNSVVVKPPEVSPCSVLELGRILQEAGLPDGVRCSQNSTTNRMLSSSSSLSSHLHACASVAMPSMRPQCALVPSH